MEGLDGRHGHLDRAFVSGVAQGLEMVPLFVWFVAEDRGVVRASSGLQPQDVLPPWSSLRTYPGRPQCQDGPHPRTCLGIVVGVAQPQGVFSPGSGRSSVPGRGSCGWRSQTYSRDLPQPHSKVGHHHQILDKLFNIIFRPSSRLSSPNCFF